MRERNGHALRRTSVTWIGGAFHCVCMTTDVRSPIRRMRLLIICRQLVDDCMIGGQYGRILWGHRAVRIHHCAMDFENWTVERGGKTFSVGQRSRACGDALDDVLPLAGSRTRWTSWGSVGSVTNHPAPGSDEAFALQYRDSSGDGTACDVVSSLEGARAGELDVGFVAAGTAGFAQFGGDSCCGWATYSSQSRTAVLDRLRGLGYRRVGRPARE